MTRWIAAVAAGALLLTGCGGDDTDPAGLLDALDADGIGLDPGTSAVRYYEAVQNVCESDEFGGWASRFVTATEAGNTEALDRMLVGMAYMCPDEGEELRITVEAIRAFEED